MAALILAGDERHAAEIGGLLPAGLRHDVPTVTVDTDHDDDRLLLDEGRPALLESLAPRRADVRRLMEALQERDVDRIVALGEGAQVLAAAARAVSGLPGPSLSDIRFFRDKLAMKSRLRACGVPIPDFASAEDRDGVRRLMAGHVDLLVKPRISYASRGIVRIRAGQDIAALDRPGSMMVEEFVDGPIYHADGIVAGSRIAQIMVAEYIHAPLAFLIGEAAGTMVCRDDATRRPIAEFMERVIAAAPRMGSYAFHADIHLHPHTGLMAGEIACRPAGNRIRGMLRASTGIDPTQANLRAQLGLPVRRLTVDEPVKGIAWGAVRKRHGLLDAPPDLAQPPDGVVGPVFHGTVGIPMTAAQGNSDLLVSFLVLGDTRGELLEGHARGIAWAEETVRRVTARPPRITDPPARAT